jgi:hypothetical protein
MTIKSLSDRTVPIAVGVLAVLAVAMGWLMFQGAPFVLGCIVMLALTGSEVALVVRPDKR